MKNEAATAGTKYIYGVSMYLGDFNRGMPHKKLCFQNNNTCVITNHYLSLIQAPNLPHSGLVLHDETLREGMNHPALM
jgi:hypothetical protein